VRQVRQTKTRTDKAIDHSCFLLYPEEDVSFSMTVSRGDSCINVSPVSAHGVDAKFMSSEARKLIEEWAKEEALRVGLS
jgi:hypothetical protein